VAGSEGNRSPEFHLLTSFIWSKKLRITLLRLRKVRIFTANNSTKAIFK